MRVVPDVMIGAPFPSDIIWRSGLIDSKHLIKKGLMMKRSHIFMLGTGLVLAMAGCQQQTDSAPADAAPPAAVAPPPPAPKPDVLKQDQVAVIIELESPVKVAADGRSVEIPVKVTNNGTALLSSELQPPVKLATQIMSAAGDMKSEGAVRDFVRTPLPAVAPGASVSVLVQVPVSDRIAGRQLAIGMVQETVAWFSGWGQQDLVVGPFNPCDGKVCDAAGKPL